MQLLNGSRHNCIGLYLALAEWLYSRIFATYVIYRIRILGPIEGKEHLIWSTCVYFILVSCAVTIMVQAQTITIRYMPTTDE